MLLFTLAHLTLSLFCASHSLTLLSMFFPYGFLSFFLSFSLILSLRPIFCLIAPISSTSRCPNSESVHFNLIVSLVAMMDSLSAGNARQPVPPVRLVKCECFIFCPKKQHLYLLKGQLDKFVNTCFSNNLCMEMS